MKYSRASSTACIGIISHLWVRVLPSFRKSRILSLLRILSILIRTCLPAHKSWVRDYKTFFVSVLFRTQKAQSVSSLQPAGFVRPYLLLWNTFLCRWTLVWSIFTSPLRTKAIFFRLVEQKGLPKLPNKWHLVTQNQPRSTTAASVLVDRQFSKRIHVSLCLRGVGRAVWYRSTADDYYFEGEWRTGRQDFYIFLEILNHASLAAWGQALSDAMQYAFADIHR